MNRGYFKVWRKTIDSKVLRDRNAWQLFGYLLCKTTHQTKEIEVNGVTVTLEPGQCVFGRKSAAEKLGRTEEEIRQAMYRLKKWQIATSKATNKFSIISIINWSLYQDDEPHNNQQDNQQNNQQTTSKQPANNHVLNTIKHIKHNEEKNDVLRTSPRTRKKSNGSKAPSIFLCKESFRWEGISDQDLELWLKAYPACDIPIELEKMAAWCKANPEKGHKKNWAKFITGWLSRTQDSGGTRGGVQKSRTKPAKYNWEEEISDEEWNRLKTGQINPQ